MSRAARLAAAALLAAAAAVGHADEASPPVRFYPAADVAAAFQRGAVLFDGAGGNYMVHASRREKPGLAELHAKDADVIYVLEGTAALVTGGTIVDPRTVAPDEVRGTSIQGGDVRELKKGDVLIVPRDVPHWFRDVPGAFLYYVVKVR